VTDLVNWAKVALRLGNIAFLVAILSIGAALLFLRPRWGRRWMVAVTLAYWFVSTPLGSSLLVAPLAHGYHSIEDPGEAGSASAIVVLGSGISELVAGSEALAYPDDSTTLRVLEAARVFRLLEGRPIVVVSGGITSVDQRTPEGEVTADALERLRVPRDHLVIENVSRTTHEQAIIITRLLRSRGIDRFVLVTSPTHMPRSVAVFRAQGAEVVASVAHLAPDHSQSPPFLMPNQDSFAASDEALYDYAGTVYYWARGWFRPVAAQGSR